jgi:hypothetical protein
MNLKKIALFAALLGGFFMSAAHAQNYAGRGGPSVYFTPAGTFSDFVHDDAPAINAALTAASNAGGGWVVLNSDQPYWAQTQITVPAGVTLGCMSPPIKQFGTTNILQNYVTLGCAIYLAPNKPIIVNGGAVKNARVLQDNIHFAGQPATAHALATITANFPTTGTGIKMNAPDSIVEDVAIVGFNLDIEDNSLNRGSIRHVLLEGTNCIKYDAVGDYSKGIDIECWPFYSTNRGAVSSYTASITNVADNGSGSWRVTLSGAPSEALVTGDSVSIGGGGALVMPQGALGLHTITVIDSTHFDLTGSNDAPVITGTTTSGSPYITALSSQADLNPGMTFTGTCFTGTRTVRAIQQASTLVADAQATSSGSCTLTFASQAFSAAGTPQVIYSARNDWTGVGIEFGGGGAASGGLFNNIYVWGHQVALQFDPSTITITADAVSVDYTASAYYRQRVGIWFKSGAQWNKISGNSITSGGTAVWNQNALSCFCQANIVKLGRVGGWSWGSIENDSGSLIVSGTIDPDNSQAAGQFNGDVFNVTGQNLWLADGSDFNNSNIITNSGPGWNSGGTNGIVTDGSLVGGANGFQYPPGKMQLGTNNGTAGNILLYGSTAGSSIISASASGALQLGTNNGQNMIFNEGGFGTAFQLLTVGASIANRVNIKAATTGNAPSIAAAGSDTNVNLALAGQGSGTIALNSLVSGSGVATTSQYLAGTSGEVVQAGVMYTAETTTTFGATTTFDFSTFINTSITLTGNITTQTLSNVAAGKAGMITFIQDGTGSRTTVWNSIFKFANGLTPTLSTAPNAIDVLTYSCRSATICVASLASNVK